MNKENIFINFKYRRIINNTSKILYVFISIDFSIIIHIHLKKNIKFQKFIVFNLTISFPSLIRFYLFITKYSRLFNIKRLFFLLSIIFILYKFWWFDPFNSFSLLLFSFLFITWLHNFTVDLYFLILLILYYAILDIDSFSNFL